MGYYIVMKLENLGIKNTLQLFEKVLTQKQRKELAIQTAIDEQDVLELTQLTDLSCIKWVGGGGARLLFDSGYDTVENVSSTDYEDLYKSLIRINQEQQYTKGKFGLNDMKLCVEAARDVPLDIEY